MKNRDFTKKSRFHEKGFKFARGGRLLSSIQSGAVRAWVGEGSTCPSRGKLWLTVYRAHPINRDAVEIVPKPFEMPSAHLVQVGRRAEGSIFFWIFLLEGGRSWHLNSLQRTWSKWAGALKGVFFFGFFYLRVVVPGI